MLQGLLLCTFMFALTKGNNMICKKHSKTLAQLGSIKRQCAGQTVLMKGPQGKQGGKGEPGAPGPKGSVGRMNLTELNHLFTEIREISTRFSTLENNITKLTTELVILKSNLENMATSLDNKECNGVAFDFTSTSRQTSSYTYACHYSRNYQYMQTSTKCFWVEANEVETKQNLFQSFYLIWIENLTIRIQNLDSDKVMIFSNTLKKFHLCLTILNEDVSLYINGLVQKPRICKNNNDLVQYPWYYRQRNCFGERFVKDINKFKGKIMNFMLWPKILTKEEIQKVATTCTCPKQNIDWSIIDFELSSDVTWIFNQQCQEQLKEARTNIKINKVIN